MHAWYGGDVGHVFRNISYATAVMDTFCFHAWGNGETDSIYTPFWICHNKVGSERIKLAICALNACIKTFEIDTEIGVLSHDQSFLMRTNVLY